ncbi:hypothetical protein Zmor_020674 [Zophobas morio]|uniref:Uncharacterized protein n=1 Tax=Zophobas morio TaxID=2755281 RepID=A0AA38M9X0_9CUCU|nr:hypothetical protein Zmor_020674 [Zophobas morio]
MTLVNRRPVTIGGKTKNWHNANWDAPGFSRTIGEHFPAIGAHFPATYRIGTNTQNARSRLRGPVEVSFASCASPGLRWPLVFSPQPFSRLSKHGLSSQSLDTAEWDYLARPTWRGQLGAADLARAILAQSQLGAGTLWRKPSWREPSWREYVSI